MKTPLPGRKRKGPREAGRHDLHRRLQEEISRIGQGLSRSLRTVMQALEEHDTGRARRLLHDLEQLRNREGAYREMCFRILAAMEGNTEELRWTDKAHRILFLMEQSVTEIRGIAEDVARIDGRPADALDRDLPEMGRLACGMLDRSANAVLRREAGSAREILRNDSSLDRSCDAFAEKAGAFLTLHPEAAHAVRPYLSISERLERIGDHASHMAEEVIYFLDGTGTDG